VQLVCRCRDPWAEKHSLPWNPTVNAQLTEQFRYLAKVCGLTGVRDVTRNEDEIGISPFSLPLGEISSNPDKGIILIQLRRRSKVNIGEMKPAKLLRHARSTSEDMESEPAVQLIKVLRFKDPHLRMDRYGVGSILPKRVLLSVA
jgi:hypothetical protein